MISVVWCIIGTKIPKSSVIHKCIESLFIHGSMSVFFGYHGRLSSLVTGVCVHSGFPSLFLVGFVETAFKLKNLHVREGITGGILVVPLIAICLCFSLFCDGCQRKGYWGPWSRNFASLNDFSNSMMQETLGMICAVDFSSP